MTNGNPLYSTGNSQCSVGDLNGGDDDKKAIFPPAPRLRMAPESWEGSDFCSHTSFAFSFYTPSCWLHHCCFIYYFY